MSKPATVRDNRVWTWQKITCQFLGVTYIHRTVKNDEYLNPITPEFRTKPTAQLLFWLRNPLSLSRTLHTAISSTPFFPLL